MSQVQPFKDEEHRKVLGMAKGGKPITITDLFDLADKASRLSMEYENHADRRDRARHDTEVAIRVLQSNLDRLQSTERDAGTKAWELKTMLDDLTNALDRAGINALNRRVAKQQTEVKP